MIKRNIAEKRFWEWTFGYNFKIKFDFLGWNSFVNYFYAEALALNGCSFFKLTVQGYLTQVSLDICCNYLRDYARYNLGPVTRDWEWTANTFVSYFVPVST